MQSDSNTNIQQQPVDVTDRLGGNIHLTAKPIESLPLGISSYQPPEDQCKCVLFSNSSDLPCSCNVKDPYHRRSTSSGYEMSKRDQTRHHGDGVCIIDSFGTLNVSNSPTACSNGHMIQSVPVLRSCREEAAACASCLDDTTVDDLAGYLDEIMFIPKPMSEMAELMYT